MPSSRFNVVFAAVLLSAAGLYVSHIAYAQEAASPATARHAGTQCYASEKIAFSCELPGKKIVSVCKAPESVIYRYGAEGAPEMTLASNGKDGLASWGFAFAKHNREAKIRFEKDGYHYMVYSQNGVADSGEGPPVKSAGLFILNGKPERIPRPLDCISSTYQGDKMLEAVDAFLPEEPKGSYFQGFW